MAKTIQRSLIYDIVKNSCCHLTADEVFKIAKQRMPTIVLATVYNNLNALYNAGEIGRVMTSGGSFIYDHSPIRHAHTVCEKCGKIEDTPLPDLDKVLKDDYKISFDSFDITFNAICKECKNS